MKKFQYGWMKFFLCSFLLIVGLTNQGSGQNSQVWFEYMLNYPFANSWNVEFASTYSTVMNQPKWRSLDFQVTPEYAITERIDVMAAFYVGKTYQNQSLSTSEIREMVGARFHFTPNKRILTRMLFRFEQRNQLQKETDQWSHSTRTRLRAETLTPINKPTMFSGDKLLYLILDAEAFIIHDKDIEERFANRFRFRSGLGYRVNYGLRVEFVYTLQESKNTIEDDFNTTDNIFRFRIKQYLNKAKPSKLVGPGN